MSAETHVVKVKQALQVCALVNDLQKAMERYWNIFGIRALAHLHLRTALLDQVHPAGVGAALLDEACRGADRTGGVGAGATPGGIKQL